ncbi:hypothetical protein HDU98_003590 [Podochytrium sp. JEL0797]|nr:hypothetical protein HDU98_003590 [Podochytrium sp. JEL0797]
METLPFEVLQRIFSLVPPNESLRFRRLNAMVQRVINDSHFATQSLDFHVYRETHLRHICAGPGEWDRRWMRWPAHFQEAYSKRLARGVVVQIRWGLYFFGRCIPQGIGGIASLTHLDLKGNGLGGTLIEELGGLVNLKVLCLADNSLEGPLPTTLSTLSKLECLNLRNNRLSGLIPSSLGRLTLLQQLDLESNQFHGPICPDLMTLSKLWSLDLSCNQLTGAIPDEISNLTNLEDLCLAQNKLSGLLPASLAKLESLQQLELRDNAFEGCIPMEWGVLRNLRLLDLKNNRLSGRVPVVELGGLKALWSLELGGNAFELVDAEEGNAVFQDGGVSEQVKRLLRTALEGV